jgi:hypothetical protein
VSNTTDKHEPHCGHPQYIILITINQHQLNAHKQTSDVYILKRVTTTYLRHTTIVKDLQLYTLEAQLLKKATELKTSEERYCTVFLGGQQG